MEAFPNNTDERKVVPSNSIKKDETKQPELPEAIIEGEVKKKKQTFGDKAKKLLIKEDAKSVWSYVFGDILIPALKNTFVSMVQNGVDLWVNGSVTSKRNAGNGGRVTRTPYSSYYQEDEDYRGRRKAYAAPTYSYDEIEFDSRGDAEAVLMRLRQRIFEFGSVSIAYLYSLVRWSSDWTANQYGWINLEQAYIMRTTSGTFVLKLPRPVEL